MKSRMNLAVSVFFFSAFFCDLTTASAQTEDAEPSNPGASGEEDPQAPSETSAEPVVADAAAAGSPVIPDGTIYILAVPPAPPAAAPTADAGPAPATSLTQEARPPRVPGRGLRIAGASMMGGGYGASLLLGLLMLDFDATVGAYYCIPLAGGYIMGGKAAADAGDEGKFSLFMLASLPSIVQTAGLIMLISGISKGEKWKKEQAKKPVASFVPVGPSGSPGLSVTGRF